MELLGLALLVLDIVATWYIFVKAKDEGWKALIPFYSKYTYCKHGGCIKLFWIDFVLKIISYALTVFVGITLLLAMVNIVSGGFLALEPFDFICTYLGVSAITAVFLFFAGIVTIVGTTVVNVFINLKVINCFTDETVFKVLAGIGSFPPFHVALVVAKCIIGFDNKYVYTKPNLDD